MSPNTSAFAQSGDINYKEAMIPFSPNAGSRKPFYDRVFGKLGKGSLRGSIFSLCASAIGSGVLSLPYVLGLNGWVLGLVFILVGGFCKLIVRFSLFSCCLESLHDCRVSDQSQGQKLLTVSKQSGRKGARTVPADQHSHLHVGLVHFLLNHQ